MRMDVLVWTVLGGAGIALGLHILTWMFIPPKSDKSTSRRIVLFIIVGLVVAYFVSSAYFAEVPYQEPPYNPDQEACYGGAVGCP
jgi:phage shock protein PspC (stress-responsive transcriptional regulator)